MPAFLDYMMRTTPEQINPDFYGDLYPPTGETLGLVQGDDNKHEQGYHHREQAYFRQAERASFRVREPEQANFSGPEQARHDEKFFMDESIEC